MSETSENLRGQVAVVTGGASGIGLATAVRFAAEGMKLVLSDVEQGALEKARKDLEEQGADVIAVAADVSKAESVDALAKASVDHFGAVHVVFNNAGVCVPGSIWESSLDDLRWSLDVNLWGVIHGIRSFVPILLEQDVRAHVVNTASMAAVSAAPYLDIYTATKHGVLALTECLHKELEMLGSPVRAHAVCPGFIQSNLMTGDRNKPGDPERDPEGRELSAGGQTMNQALVAGTGPEGWPPSKVADAIVEGIRKDRFYVMPAQEAILATMHQRLDELRDLRNPGMPAILQQQED
jgi:NAD(P)-dependent dehydrogenase (short-subunit alcohol dehydrogenase family)